MSKRFGHITNITLSYLAVKLGLVSAIQNIKCLKNNLVIIPALAAEVIFAPYILHASSHLILRRACRTTLVFACRTFPYYGTRARRLSNAVHSGTKRG